MTLRVLGGEKQFDFQEGDSGAAVINDLGVASGDPYMCGGFSYEPVPSASGMSMKFAKSSQANTKTLTLESIDANDTLGSHLCEFDVSMVLYATVPKQRVSFPCDLSACVVTRMKFSNPGLQGLIRSDPSVQVNFEVTITPACASTVTATII